MSGPYWDVRTCCWQGGAPPQAPPPVLVVRPRAVAGPELPVQSTAADAEPVQARVRTT